LTRPDTASHNFVASQQKNVYIPAIVTFPGSNISARLIRRNRGIQAMADPIYQVPNEVRDFAEKSVEQARKAFEGFAGAAQKAIHSTPDLPLVPPAAKDVGAKALSYAEANVNAAFDLAQKLVQAKDPQEVFQLQSEFLKSQFSAFQEQTKELSSAFQKSTTGKA
jgi:phasin